jgi:hypothetical protein
VESVKPAGCQAKRFKFKQPNQYSGAPKFKLFSYFEQNGRYETIYRNILKDMQRNIQYHIQTQEVNSLEQDLDAKISEYMAANKLEKACLMGGSDPELMRQVLKMLVVS